MHADDSGPVADVSQRRGVVVALRDGPGRPLHQIVDRSVSQLLARGSDEVEQAGLGDRPEHRLEMGRGRHGSGCPRAQRSAVGQPGGQLTTGRMSNCRNTIQQESSLRHILSRSGQVIDGTGHVGHRGGPAATVTDPAVLDGCRRDAIFDEVGGQRLGQVDAVLGAPESAVQDDDDRQVLTRRKVQPDELARDGAP